MSQYKFLALCVFAFLALGVSVNAERNVDLEDVDFDIRKINIQQNDGIYDAIPDGMKYDNPMMTVDSDSEIEEMLDESIELRNPLVKVAIKIIKAAFKWAAISCIEQAAEQCISHWNNPGALVDCAKNYFAANKGRCALG